MARSTNARATDAALAEVTPLRSPAKRRTATSTSNFGSGRREAHDASAFYDRFVPPEVSADTSVAPAGLLDVIHHHDARDMSMVASNSVALVVTSPPYFAGKQYEESLGENGVPANYFEYLQLLRDVFAEAKRVLEPGGRIAVNVANLGRRPYRSLSGDVTDILQDLGLLLRGEVIWWKGRAAGGSCAWGTFQRPGNPVLRDVTERIVIASKGRFDRALTPKARAERGLPATATITRDEFMEATTDLWEIAPESATRVGHPAPFPVDLPNRLIELYTYVGDVVLDPFMGSGSTAVAAVRTGRHFIGFDTDESYIASAVERIEGARAEPREPAVELSPTPAVPLDDPVATALREGRQAKDVAALVLAGAGFTELRANVKPRGLGITVDYVAVAPDGTEWAVDVSGAFTSNRSGLRRADTLWKSLATAAVLHESADAPPLLLLTTDAPAKNTAGAMALAAVTGPGKPVAAVLELLAADTAERLARLGEGGR